MRDLNFKDGLPASNQFANSVKVEDLRPMVMALEVGPENQKTGSQGPTLI